MNAGDKKPWPGRQVPLAGYRLPSGDLRTSGVFWRSLGPGNSDEAGSILAPNFAYRPRARISTSTTTSSSVSPPLGQ